MGIEPTFIAWEAIVLPLDDARVRTEDSGRRGSVKRASSASRRKQFSKIAWPKGKLAEPNAERRQRVLNRGDYCRRDRQHAVSPMPKALSGIDISRREIPTDDAFDLNSQRLQIKVQSDGRFRAG
jgi:hypothetical protein